jgi:hypothetical protein
MAASSSINRTHGRASDTGSFKTGAKQLTTTTAEDPGLMDEQLSRNVLFFGPKGQVCTSMLRVAACSHFAPRHIRILASFNLACGVHF